MVEFRLAKPVARVRVSAGAFNNFNKLLKHVIIMKLEYLIPIGAIILYLLIHFLLKTAKFIIKIVIFIVIAIILYLIFFV